MAITVKSVTTNGLTGNGSVSTVSVTTPAASVGDLLVIILGNDWYTQAGLSLQSITPTATATEITSFDADGGSLKPHMKAWWAPVTTAGAVTVVGDTANKDEEKALVVYVISGADTTTPIDVSTAISTVTTSTTPAAPSVSPTGATDLLICHFQSDGTTGGASGTAPGSMSNAYSQSEGGLATAFGASQILSASGATGTRTWTFTGNVPYVCASMAIKAAAGGGGGGTSTTPIAWLHV